MEEKIDEQKKVSIADALKTQIVVNQALVNLLVAKGIFSREEFMEQIRTVKKEIEAAVKSD